jgi:hypothetical protein
MAGEQCLEPLMQVIALSSICAVFLLESLNFELQSTALVAKVSNLKLQARDFRLLGVCPFDMAADFQLPGVFPLDMAVDLGLEPLAFSRALLAQPDDVTSQTLDFCTQIRGLLLQIRNQRPRLPQRSLTSFVLTQPMVAFDFSSSGTFNTACFLQFSV